MIVEVHTPVWNEEFRLPWFLDHYEKVVDRIYVYDNYSNDKTVEIAKAHPKVELRFYGTPINSNENLRLMKNNCWKGTNADWVIVCDVDELVYHPNLRKLLSETKATILRPAEAWDILSRERPVDYKTLRRVTPAPFYRKNFIFKPSAIREMNYGHGAHAAIPLGNVIIESPEELLMLHYQFIDEERLVIRYRTNRDRRSAQDIAKGWSIHYDISEAQVRALFNRETIDVWNQTKVGEAWKRYSKTT